MTLLKATLCGTAAALLIFGSATAAPGFGAGSWRMGSSGNAPAKSDDRAADILAWLRNFMLGERVEVQAAETKQAREGVVAGSKGAPASQKPAGPKTDEERIADSQKAPQPLPLAF